LKRTELRWAVLFALVVSLVLYLPYFAGYLLRPPGTHYVWEVYNADEAAVYESWLYQAMEGKWLLVDLFTTEPQPHPLFFNAYFVAFGKLAKILFPKAAQSGVPTAAQYIVHLARLLSNWFMLVVGYWFASVFLAGIERRRLAVMALAFASGLGWLVVPLAGYLGLLHRPFIYYLPVDLPPGLVMPEATGFMSLYCRPLFAFSIGLIMLVLGGFWRALKGTNKRKNLIIACLAMLILANVHTYDAPLLAIILGLWWLLSSIRTHKDVWANLYKTALIILAAVPGVSYSFYIFAEDPIWRAKAETSTPSPPVLAYLLTYAVPLILVMLVLYRRRHVERFRFLLVALACTGVMLYAPVSFQRKVAEVLVPVLAVLSVAGLQVLVSLWPRARRRLAWSVAVACFLVLVVPSDLFIMRDSIRTFAKGGQPQAFLPSYYISQGEFEMLRLLRQEGRSGEAVLASPLFAAYIPAYTGLKVFVGHWAETLRMEEKLRAWREFYQAPHSLGELRHFCRKQGIQWLVIGPLEGSLMRPDFPLAELAEEVAASGDETLYRVREGDASR